MLALALAMVEGPEEQSKFRALAARYERLMFHVARQILPNEQDAEDAVQEAICAAFGASITYAKALMHGKQSQVRFDPDCPLFRGCPETALVGRYHSLAADTETLPECLKITARTEDGEVMAVQHRAHPVYGVQFHPESILTPDGKTMLQNFIKEM